MLYQIKMKFLSLTVLLFYSHNSFCERLFLSLAEKAFLPLPHNQKVHIGNHSLVAIQKEKGQLSLLAKKKGHTLLITGNKQYEIFIFDKNKKLQALKLNQLLKNCWGLNWSLSDNNTFRVTGTLNRIHDWVDLFKLSKQHNIIYEFKALAGEGLKKPIQYYFKSLFKNKTPPEIAWSKLPFVDIPKGVNLSYYQKLLQPFGLTPKEDPLWLSHAPFIEIEMALVEKLNSSGWSFGGETNPNNSFSQFSSLLNFLKFLNNSGKGKTLHHSSIVAQSGQPLQLQSGGQLPFNSYNLKTEQHSVQWKSHGFRLNITPKLGKQQHIELAIKAKVSEPLAFASANSPPPIKTQNLENTVVLKDGEILKLFQLKKYSQGTQNQGQLDFLLNLPGSLFSGKNSSQMTQLIFIQAKVIRNNKQNLLKETPHLFSN